jgi:signal peptidase II
MAWLNPWFGLSAVILLLDQITKFMAEKYLLYGQPETIIEGFFDLRLAYNSGAAFSFLSDAGGWQRWFFIGLAVAVSIWLINWLKDTSRNDVTTSGGIALVLGGAIGNAWDRFSASRTMVVDFLDFYVGTSHWPAFNVADIGICIGAGLLILAMIRGEVDDISVRKSS